MQDVIAGRMDFMCATIQSGAAQARQGTVKGIAIMARQALVDRAGSATTGEQGLPGVEASVWNAFFVPKGTPDAIVRKLNKAMSDTVDNPAIHKRLEELGLEIVPRGASLAGISRQVSARGNRALEEGRAGRRHHHRLTCDRYCAGGDAGVGRRKISSVVS